MALYLVLRRDDDGQDILIGAVKSETELLDLVVNRERPIFQRTIKCGCKGAGHTHDNEFQEHVRRAYPKYRMEIAG